MTELEPIEQPEPPLLAELIVELESPTIDGEDLERRAQATAKLRYRPPVGSGEREIKSGKFTVRAPIGPIEAGEIAWYLEGFAVWPSRHFRPRAEAVEAQLDDWGRALFAALDQEPARKAWEAFRHAPGDVERVVSIEVDPDLGDVDGVDDGARAAAQEAATLLLGLPWELLHDDSGFLADGKRGVRVRRRLPNRDVLEPMVTAAPVRVLVVSPRPEDRRTGYIDHRVSAGPLVKAFAALGGRVDLKILETPTIEELQKVLAASDQPYHVVHFDGHGIYSQEHKTGALCFEKQSDIDRLEERRSHWVAAELMAEVLRDHQVSLVFLEACQSAMSSEDPTASVAGRLLRGGVASVIAMSHSVLVETARRFVETFYQHLSGGSTVGAALHAAQRKLRDDPTRGRSFFGDLWLNDWFVPVLYQKEADPQLVRELPGRGAQDFRRLVDEKAVEGVPRTPDHGFIGRSRVLLAIERLLVNERWAVLVGEGGQGKTTLAVELARWLVASRRFEAAAFVSVEDGASRDARTVLAALGHQLVPGFGTETDFERMWQLVERRLRERRTILVFDNLESILETAEFAVFEPEVRDAILALAERCSQVGRTRVVLTSRSELPSPFSSPRHVVRIGRLGKKEAIELVAQVLGRDAGVVEESADDERSDVGLLVETAKGHARSLVLLAQEVRRSGIRATTEGLRELMVSMAERFPEDRERSLFASVELSLRRLPPELRPTLRRLGVFRGGGHGFVIAQVLGLDYQKDEEVALGNRLVEVGLAQWMPYQHLRLHPALPPMMLAELDDAEREEVHGAWVGAMVQLTNFLLQQRFKDTQLSATLTLLELPNLLGALGALARSPDASGEQVVDMTTSLESLLAPLDRPRALARVVEIRDEASRKLGDWSRARFLAESAAIDRLIETGRLGEALPLADEVLRKARAACPEDGAESYPVAAYDLALALARRGRILQMGGRADASLEPLAEARDRFTRLAEAGNVDAERMASTCTIEIGDSLAALGRLDEAASAYEAAMELGEARGDQRDVAVGKTQLATVRMLQRRFQDALKAYGDARKIFEDLGEPGAVATIWHQVGMVHQEAGQHDAAERAYRQSLTIRVQRKDRTGEASSLNQLGNLYGRQGRLEEAVRFYRDAVKIDQELGDLKNEGMRRSNLAIQLIRLERYDEARQEIVRAIECKKPFGHAALPWTTFDILHDLERAVGDDDAAVEARERAIEAFLAYRRDGGENLFGRATPQLCAAVHQAIANNEIEAAKASLGELASNPELPDYLRKVVPALQAILDGSRDPALASDPELHYSDAVELRLLLESLAASGR